MRLGYYGKVPERGDFLRFNLPQSLINVWDDWLQLALINGEQQHGNLWSDLYHSAPPHRFTCAKDVMGPEPWFGVFVSSNDKVGRRFPFCILGTVSTPFTPVQGLLKFQPLLQHLERLAGDLSRGITSVDSLNATLEELSGAWYEQDAVAPSNQCSDSDSFVVRSISGKGGDFKDFTTAILDSYMQQHYQQVCVFQSCALTSSSQHDSNALDTTALFVSSGLPDPNEGMALFTDQFDPKTINLTQLAVAEVAKVAAVEPVINDADAWDALQSIEPEKKPESESEPEPAEAERAESSSEHEADPLKASEIPYSESPSKAQDPTTGIVGFSGKPSLADTKSLETDDYPATVRLTPGMVESTIAAAKAQTPIEVNASEAESESESSPAKSPLVETLDIAEEDLSSMPWEED